MIGLALSGVLGLLGGLLALHVGWYWAVGERWGTWEVLEDLPYAEVVRRRRLWARAALSLPLWFWLAAPAAVSIAAGWVVWRAAAALRRLLRLAFPGELPSDGDGPAGGAYR